MATKVQAALQEAVDYLNGAIGINMDENEKAMVARWTGLLQQQVLPQDIPVAALDAVRASVYHLLHAWDEQGLLEEAMGCDYDDLGERCNELATALDDPGEAFRLSNDAVLDFINGLTKS